MKRSVKAISVSLVLHVSLLVVALLLTVSPAPKESIIQIFLEAQTDESLQLESVSLNDFEVPAASDSPAKIDVSIDMLPNSMPGVVGINNGQHGTPSDRSSVTAQLEQGGLENDFQVPSCRVTAGLIAGYNMSGFSRWPGRDNANQGSRPAFEESLAYEIAMIRPGQIFAVVCVPLSRQDSIASIDEFAEQNRHSVIEWLLNERYRGPQLAAMNPAPSLVILASELPYPMEDLRRIVGERSKEFPLHVYGLQFDRTRAGELREMATKCGGTYFGVQ